MRRDDHLWGQAFRHLCDLGQSQNVLGFVYGQHQDIYATQRAQQTIRDPCVVVPPVAKAHAVHFYDKDSIFFAVLLRTCVVAHDPLNGIISSAFDAGLVKNLRVAFEGTDGIMIEMRVRYQNEVGVQFWKTAAEPAPTGWIAVRIDHNLRAQGGDPFERGVTQIVKVCSPREKDGQGLVVTPFWREGGGYHHRSYRTSSDSGLRALGRG